MRSLRSRVVGAAAAATLIALAAPVEAGGEDFSYLPPGDLAPNSGEGREDYTVYAPGMRYPVEAAPSFPNSQVWGRGGSQGGGGSQCDAENYSYPWRDNYCEERQWDMPLCPSGVGHQGQDIRGATCEDDTHWIVSASDGVVTSIGSYSLYVTAPDGTRFDYLHGASLQVQEGDTVTRGQRIARISNEFGGTPTTIHLHFNIRQSVDGVGNVYVPPYMSLVEAYEALIGPPAQPVEGALDEVSCEGIAGWAAALDALDEPVEAVLTFDATPGDPEAIGHPLLASRRRDDLCDAIGSCDHGFATHLPLSLLDGTAHVVHAQGRRGLAGDAATLAGSPGEFSCELAIPAGVRRRVRDRDAENAWRFSSFWDVAEVSLGVLETLAEGDALPDVPRVVATEEAPEELWWIDRDRRREVSSDAAAAWELDPRLAERISVDELAALEEGLPLPDRPFVLRGPDGDAYLVDALPDTGPAGSGGGAPASTTGAGPTGAGGGGGAGDGATSGDGGCGCDVPGAPPRRGGLTALALLGLLAAAWRRRASTR